MNQKKLEFYTQIAEQDLAETKKAIEQRKDWIERKLMTATYAGEFTSIATLATEITQLLEKAEGIEKKLYLLKEIAKED